MKRLAYLLIITATLMACEAGGGGKPTIAVTIEPLRYFAEKIGGDRFDVVTMVPGGASPETYEPTAQQMAALSESCLYIEAGNLGFERTWMKRLGANASHLIVVNSSEGIAPVAATDGNAVGILQRKPRLAHAAHHRARRQNKHQAGRCAEPHVHNLPSRADPLRPRLRP